MREMRLSKSHKDKIFDDIKDLIARLYQQSNEYLERVKMLKGEE